MNTPFRSQPNKKRKFNQKEAINTMDTMDLMDVDPEYTNSNRDYGIPSNISNIAESITKSIVQNDTHAKNITININIYHYYQSSHNSRLR